MTRITALLAVCFAATPAAADFFSNEDGRPRSAAFSHEERERIIADYYCNGRSQNPGSNIERQQCEERRQAALRELSERGAANHRAAAPHIRQLRQMHDALRAP